MPLEPKDLTASGLVQFPTVVGGDVPVVNLDGIGPNDLVLDGPTLANIFLGKITKWDDPAIKKLNPNAKLPSNAIVVVHRSDGSGTTFIFTDYLSKVSPDWKSNVGASTAVEWPAGIGAKGNEGVSNNVAQTKGAIGYVEYAYALQNKMTTVKMVNKDGKAVAANAAAFQAAAAGADWANSENYYVILTNEPGPESWPIAGATFILMYKQPPGSSPTRPLPSSSSTGPIPTAARPPKNSTMCRCRRRSSPRSKRLGRRKSRGPTASRSSRSDVQHDGSSGDRRISRFRSARGAPANRPELRRSSEQ